VRGAHRSVRVLLPAEPHLEQVARQLHLQPGSRSEGKGAKWIFAASGWFLKKLSGGVAPKFERSLTYISWVVQLLKHSFISAQKS
jgi:hypothetical protein